MTDTISTIRLEATDLSRPKDQGIAEYFMELGKQEGWFPADRAGLTGEEYGLIAYLHDGNSYISVGVALGYVPEGHDFFWLDIFIVETEYRRMGIGRRMLAEMVAIADARPQGTGRMMLSTLVANQAFQRLAAQAGFSPYALQMNRMQGGAA